MKKTFFVFLVLSLGFFLAASSAQEAKTGNHKIILLISEQNIAGPQQAWWASEVDLSATESTISQNLIAAGYQVVEPQAMTEVLKEDPAFRLLDISNAESVKLAGLSQADYAVVGKAVASSGGNLPQSNMRSCFANLSAKLIRVKDGVVVAYFDAVGNSAHLDVITGGREALAHAAGDLAEKIIAALNKEGGK